MLDCSMSVYQYMIVYVSRLVSFHSFMDPFYLIHGVVDNISNLRKKTLTWYRNADDSTVPPSIQSRVSTGTQTDDIISSTLSNMAPTEYIVDNANVQAVASGIDQPLASGRKGRARKPATNPRTTGPAIKKAKIVKPPRNPFRRSETGKLQLKRLQMGKRVETMTPRVEVLRERLLTMESRLTFVSSKLKLVVEELTSRACIGAPVVVDAAGVEGATSDVVDVVGGGAADTMDEDVELDDEVEAVAQNNVN